MNARTVAFVFARGGSKGLPDKNRQEVGGSTLIERAIRDARAARTVDLVAASSDDPALLRLARDAGADLTIERPPVLARDDSPEWLSWQHAIRHVGAEGLTIGAFLSVPCTAPLRHPSDVDACASRLLDGDVDAVVTGARSRRHPAFNMVTIGADSLARRAMEPEGGPVSRRQDAPPMYDLTTVCYAAWPEFVLTASGIFAGRVGFVEIPEERALDIDTPFDLHLARLLEAHPFPRSTR